jgi:exodeoxyribonuclease-5
MSIDDRIEEMKLEALRPQIVWTPQQQEAIARIKKWFYSEGGAMFFYLAGYAGTGKTTLIRGIAEVLGVNVAYAAFTGKAASVMKKKGCAGARTIDSLIYRPLIKHWCVAPVPCARPPHDCPPSKGRCSHLRQKHIGRELNPDSDVTDVDLVIIDEVSMVGWEMGRDLLSFGKKVLVLGDTAQLPPIGSAGYFTKGEPHYGLTDIQRQAAGSPVIQLATRVRNGECLTPGQYGDSRAIRYEMVDDMLEHDIVVVGRHVTRSRINNAIRKARGFEGLMPQPGERVICLKNCHDLEILNGEIWTVLGAAPDIDGLFFEMDLENDEKTKIVRVDAPAEGFTLVNCNDAMELPGHPFTFGYAITCHKAQGSQWDSVFVIDESWVWRKKQENFKWLYTAITRAAERVTVKL